MANPLLKKLSVILVILSVGTVCLGFIISLNRYRWGVLSAIGFYPSDICSLEKPTQEYNEYLGYEVSQKFFVRGGEINQKVINRIKQDRQCSLDFILYFALNNRELDSAKLLLENGAVIRAGIDFYSDLYEYRPTPLFYFVEDADTVRALIARSADVNAINKYAHNPLFFSLSREVVQTLIDNGANINAVDKKGRTPIHAAITQGAFRYIHFDSDYDYDYSTRRRDLIEVLINNGAELNPQAQNRHKTFIIDAVVSQYKTDFELIHLLLDSGADINARDKNSKTVLFYVRDVVSVQQLLGNGAELNVRDNDGRTVLFYETYDPETINLLLDRGVDINAKDNYGQTSLEFAIDDGIDYGSSRWAQLLLDSGADVNAKDNYGQTLLSKIKNEKARQFLIDNGAVVNPEDDN